MKYYRREHKRNRQSSCRRKIGNRYHHMLVSIMNEIKSGKLMEMTIDFGSHQQLEGEQEKVKERCKMEVGRHTFEWLLFRQQLLQYQVRQSVNRVIRLFILCAFPDMFLALSIPIRFSLPNTMGSVMMIPCVLI